MKTTLNLALCIFGLLITQIGFSQTYHELYKQGEQEFIKGDFQSAINTFEKVVEMDPNNSFGVYSLGYVLGYSGQPDEGLKYLDKAINLAPDSIQYHFFRGEIKGYKGDYKSAIEDITYYKDHIKNEKPQETYVLLAQYYYDSGDYKNAQLYIDKAEQDIEVLPFTFNYTKARLLLRDKEYLKAIQEASKSISQNPNWPMPYFTRAKALYEAGKYDKSIKDYDVYISSMPNDDIALSNRALAKEMINDLSGSLDDYTKAISLYDKDAITYLNRAEVYNKMNKPDLALADLNKAEQLNPKYSRIYNKKAGIYVNKKDYNNAISNYTKALNINPKDVSSLVSRSYCYLKTEKYSESFSDAKKAIDISPSNSDAYLQAGMALFNVNRYEDAKSYLTKGINKNPDDGRLYYARSAVYKEQGDNTSAANDDAKAKTLLTN